MGGSCKQEWNGKENGKEARNWNPKIDCKNSEKQGPVKIEIQMT